MSTSTNQVRVQVLLDAHDRAEAEMLTQEYFGLPLGIFLRLVTKLLIHERFDTSIDMKATGIPLKRK